MKINSVKLNQEPQQHQITFQTNDYEIVLILPVMMSIFRWYSRLTIITTSGTDFKLRSNVLRKINQIN